MFEVKFEHKDGRGEFHSIFLNGNKWLVITINKGKRRGGRANSLIRPLVVLSGRVKIFSEYKGKRKTRIYKPKEVYISRPHEFHMVEALEDSIFLEPAGTGKSTNHSRWRKLVEKDI